MFYARKLEKRNDHIKKSKSSFIESKSNVSFEIRPGDRTQSQMIPSLLERTNLQLVTAFYIPRRDAAAFSSPGTS